MPGTRGRKGRTGAKKPKTEVKQKIAERKKHRKKMERLSGENSRVRFLITDVLMDRWMFDGSMKDHYADDPYIEERLSKVNEKEILSVLDPAEIKTLQRHIKNAIRLQTTQGGLTSMEKMHRSQAKSLVKKAVDKYIEKNGAWW